MARNLSQELIDSILDHLYNDKKTLGVACTVARDWVPPCRHHLFRSLRMRHPTGTSFEDFASFLADSPATAVNVRRLSIEGDMDNATFFKILTHLPNLSALFLRVWYSSPEPAAAPVRNAFKLDYVLLDIAYHRDSKLFFKRFGGYRTDEGEESGEGEEIINDDQRNGADEGGGDRVNESDRGEVGGQDGVDGLGGDEDEVDRLSDFKDGTDESGSVEHEVPADFEDVLDDGPGSDHNPEDDFVYNAYPDAARLVNILSFFSEIKELTIDCYHLRPGRWEIPLSQLSDLIPETRSPMVHSLVLTSPIISESIFAILYRLLPLSTLESLAIQSTNWPTYPDLGALMQEARNLSKFTLFVDEYCYEDSWMVGLENCSSLRSLFISPQHSPTNVEDYDDISHREALGYTSDTDTMHDYDWYGIQALLEAGFPHIHNLSIQICGGSYGIDPRYLMQCLRAIQWGWLEDYLIDHYPDFKALTFHFNAKNTDKRGVTEQALEIYIREHLPRLQRKGVVFIKKSVPFLRSAK